MNLSQRVENSLDLQKEVRTGAIQKESGTTMSKIRYWNYATGGYQEKETIGIVRYVGESFGAAGLTNGNTYAVSAVENMMIRVIDDEEIGYLYDLFNPGPFDGSSPSGKWELVEDTTGVLSKILNKL